MTTSELLGRGVPVDSAAVEHLVAAVDGQPLHLRQGAGPHPGETAVV